VHASSDLKINPLAFMDHCLNFKLDKDGDSSYYAVQPQPHSQLRRM